MEGIIQDKLRRLFNDDSIVFDKSRFIGGMTNYNYVMDIKGTEYVIRKPGGMTDKMIDRKIEKVNNSIASEVGINSQCIYFDDDTGIKISIYLKNSKNIAVANPNSPKSIASVSETMKKMHQSPKKFPNKFDVKSELHKYEQIVEQINGALFFDYHILKEKLFAFMDENIKNTISVPCHNDTVPENFVIAQKGQTYLIDWEYAGMNDPSWDVASYIIESKLSQQSIEQLVSDYYGGLFNEEEELKIKCYMLAQDLLWTVWALIRHYHGDDFLDYCNNRYERFRKNIDLLTSSTNYPIEEMVHV
ncbi:phosphotransferase [Proteinivorax hydrogeniformans]|uniref:Phosphotransferase n=1 Tax=Proteinivorax hydrogeniformans TaxID=1826727 RepID=A0AAU8HU94_9FIRM